MASMVTSRASRGSGSREFSSIMRVSSAWSSEPQFTPMRTGFWFCDRDLDHGAEVVVVLAADADIAGIDAVLGEGARARGILLEQEMAVVVEVADDGDRDAAAVEQIENAGNGFGGGVVVDRDPHQFGAGARQRFDLLRGGERVGGIGVGHGLHDDRARRSRHERRRHRRSQLCGGEFRPSSNQFTVVSWQLSAAARALAAAAISGTDNAAPARAPGLPIKNAISAISDRD